VTVEELDDELDSEARTRALLAIWKICESAADNERAISDIRERLTRLDRELTRRK
jgi:hypothetical protein